jgi:PTS system nitrogen regulatory IIA component
MVDVKELIDRGGVYYNLTGSNSKEILEDMVKTIRLPEGVSQKELLKAILQREELMPTAVGNGIAFPHPRTPVIASEDKQIVAVCFLQDPIDFSALDKKPVNVLFLLLSASPKLHLQILSQLSFICQKEDFLALLETKPGKREIIDYIKGVDKAWS